jgi:hypothetical protein
MTSSEPNQLAGADADPVGDVERLATEALDAPEDRSRLERLCHAMAVAGTAPCECDADEIGPTGSAAFHRALARFFRRHGRIEAALRSCRSGSAADPHDIGVRQEWLQALASAGRLEDAAPALAVPPSVAGTPQEAAAISLLIRADKLLARAGLADLALDALERGRAIRPASAQLDVLLLSRAEQSCGPERAEIYRRQARERLAAGLPRRLAEGLAALRDLDEQVHLAAGAVAWAWSLADRSAWTWESWRAEVDWATRSRDLLRKWWHAAPEQGRELAELVDAPDLGELRALQQEGRAQVMAGAHVGPTWGALHIFQACGLNFRTLGGAGLRQLNGPGSTLISVGDSRKAATRELIGELRRGVLLGVLPDTPMRDDRVEVDFLGRRIALSSLPARLASRYRCPTWWCAPLWRGERIVVELERLPDPDPGEPEADWVRRWAGAYLKRLERVMRGDPRNLDLTKGVWRAAR